MASNRLIAGQDLDTAGFDDKADSWATSRGISSNTALTQMVDSWGAAQVIPDLTDGTAVVVSWLDTGTHAAVAGDYGAVGGLTPNSGYYRYSGTLNTLVRERPLESDISKAWAIGTLPGGAGTKSAKEWTEQNITISDSITTKATQVSNNTATVNAAKVTVEGLASSVETMKESVDTTYGNITAAAGYVDTVKTQTIAARDEALAFSNAKLAATWIEAAALTGLTNGQVVIVLNTDEGSHTSVAGDVGSSGGQTPNAGVYKYSTSVVSLVRYSDTPAVATKKMADIAIAAASSITGNNLVTALMPQVASYMSAADRLERYGVGLWRKVAKNTPRRWVSDDGSQVRLIAEGAVPSTVRTAPCDQPLGGSNLQQVTVASGTAAIAYAGSHTGPDIFGTGGKSIRITPNNTTTLYLANMASYVAGTLYRTAYWVSVEVPTNRQLRVGSRAVADATTKSALFDCAPDGTITFTSNGSATRGGVVFVDTLSNGAKLYCVWVDTTVTAATSQTPYIFPSSASGSWNDGSSRMFIHGVQSIPDPATLRPSPVPQLTDGAQMGDTIVPPMHLRPTNVHWIGADVSVGVCGDNTGAIAIPATYVGYNSLPLFDRVEISTGGTASRREFLLPCIQAQGILSSTLMKTFILGPGWYDVNIVRTGAGTDDLEGIYGAYDDPLLFPRLRYFERNGINRRFTVERVIGHSRVADSATVITQQCLQIQDCTEAVITDVVGMGFHASAWLGNTRGYASSRPGSTVSKLFDSANYGGTLRLERNALNTLTRYAGACAQNLLTPIQISNSTVATLNINGFAGINSTGDMLFVSVGTWTANIQNAYFGGNTNPMYDTLQSSNEIEVNDGTGWKKLSTSGLTPAQLPVGRIFYRYGSWALDGSSLPVIDTGSLNDRQIIKVDSFTGSMGLPGTKINRPGYEFQASRMIDTANDVFYEIPDKSVFISELNGPLSPSNPRIRLYVEYGSYTTGNVYTAGTIAAQNTGIHGDCIQLNTAGCFMSNMTLNNVVTNCPLSQGIFLTPRASGIDTLTATNVIVAAGQGNGFTVNSTKTGLSGPKLLSNALLITVEDGHRFAPGGSGVTTRLRSEGVSGVFALGPNVWVNTDTVYSTGTILGTGGAISGTINKFAVARVDTFTTYTPPSVDQPTLPSIESVIDTAYSPLTSTYRLPADASPDQLVFRQSFCDMSGVDWNDIVRNARTTYDKFLPCVDAFNFKVMPGRFYSVSTTAVVDTVIATGFRGARIVEGDMYRYFKIVGDELRVAKTLPAVTTSNKAFGLEFDLVDNVLVTITT